MGLVEEIQAKVAAGTFEFSRHAAGQSLKRRISVQEVREAVAGGELIEDYPDDKYGPSCLLFGSTQARRPLHIQCSHATRSLVKIITVYEPDPDQWTDGKTRKQDDDNTPTTGGIR